MVGVGVGVASGRGGGGGGDSGGGGGGGGDSGGGGSKALRTHHHNVRVVERAELPPRVGVGVVDQVYQARVYQDLLAHIEAIDLLTKWVGG